MKPSYLDGKYRLMAPGPVPVSESVRAAMALPMIHHRTPEFERILRRTLENLKIVFQTSQPVMMLASTGSGGMEAAIVNCFSPGEEIIAIVSGKFGERWAEMARVYGLKVHELRVANGDSVMPEDVKTALDQNPQVRGVMSQACETSTATWHPIEELARLTKNNPNCLLLIDGITAVGCAPLPMDAWGIDVLVAGSQKAFTLPTGLSFVALSEKAWGFNKTAQCPRYYLDLLGEKKANEKGQTHFSSSVSLVRGLDVFLREAIGCGLPGIMARCALLAATTRRAALDLNLSVYSTAPSSSVTALALPANLDGDRLRIHIEEKYNVTVMGGQDELKGKILRVGHMGAIGNADQLATIEAIGRGLLDFKHKITDADIKKAVENCYLQLTSSAHV
jgi:aspartate aminotransferase-like enzyme